MIQEKCVIYDTRKCVIYDPTPVVILFHTWRSYLCMNVLDARVGVLGNRGACPIYKGNKRFGKH